MTCIARLKLQTAHKAYKHTRPIVVHYQHKRGNINNSPSREIAI